MASANFTALTGYVATGSVKFDGTQSFKVLLVTAVPSETNLDGWSNRADVTTETSGTNYPVGGIAQPFTYNGGDTGNNRASVTYTNVSIANATVSAVGAIIYLDSGAAATDKLLHFVDFGGTVTSTAAAFSITYSTPFYINR